MILLDYISNLFGKVQSTFSYIAGFDTSERNELEKLRSGLASCDTHNENSYLEELENENMLLHYVHTSQVDIVILLLSYGADIEKVDGDGRNCLRIAIETGNVTILKVLLIFGVDVSTVINNDGTIVDNNLIIPPEMIVCIRTILRLQSTVPILESKDEIEDKLSDDDIQKYLQEKSITKFNDRIQRRKEMVNLLSLDGGGVRGLILLQILIWIEQSLNGCHLLSKFHWIAGTSTGSVVAAAMCTGRSLRECQRIYFRLKDDVFKNKGFKKNWFKKDWFKKDWFKENWFKKLFPIPTRYDAKILETFLQCNFRDEYNECRTMDHVRKKSQKLIVTSADATTSSKQFILHLFRNYTIPWGTLDKEANFGFQHPREVKIWEAVRSSSAAPLYFDPFEHENGCEYIDGGVKYNNPTDVLLLQHTNYRTAIEVIQNRTQIKTTKTNETTIGCVLSVGTGLNTEIDSELMQGLWHLLKHPVSTAFGHVIHFIQQCIGEITDANEPVKSTRTKLIEAGVPFFRFSTPLAHDISLSEANNEKLIDGLWQTIEYMNKNECQDDVNTLVGLLRNF